MPQVLNRGEWEETRPEYCRLMRHGSFSGFKANCARIAASVCTKATYAHWNEFEFNDAHEAIALTSHQIESDFDTTC